MYACLACNIPCSIIIVVLFSQYCKWICHTIHLPSSIWDKVLSLQTVLHTTNPSTRLLSMHQPTLHGDKQQLTIATVSASAINVWARFTRSLQTYHENTLVMKYTCCKTHVRSLFCTRYSYCHNACLNSYCSIILKH